MTRELHWKDAIIHYCSELAQALGFMYLFIDSDETFDAEMQTHLCDLYSAFDAVSRVLVEALFGPEQCRSQRSVGIFTPTCLLHRPKVPITWIPETLGARLLLEVPVGGASRRVADPLSTCGR